ncbi:MAG TPA: hypothetical protein QF764_07605 [Planctomycetota bacterium]|nr:hypothetical protein [Planctomycetota bacterium]
MNLSRILFVVAAAGLALVGDDPPAAPALQGTLEPDLQRVEHFVLEGAPLAAGERPGLGAHGEIRRDGVRGLVEWRRRRAEGGWQLEIEVLYPLEDLRLLGVECLTEKGPRLVWREVSRGAGRTLMAEWCDDGGGLRVLDWGTDGVLRERTDAREGAVMPLYLLELLRAGRATAGEFLVFDPLGRALEPLTAHTTHLAREGGVGFARRVELRRADGTLAGRYLFAGASLEEFQWQAGSVRARRIGVLEFAERRARYGLGEDAETVREL